MYFLLLEIWAYLLVAFLSGMLVQWFFCCRGKKKHETDEPVALSTALVGQTGRGNNHSSSHLDQHLDNHLGNATLAEDLTAETSNNETLNDSDKANVAENWRPKFFTTPPSDTDELKRIKGIGAVIEKTLNELGVYTFAQIALWNEENIVWVENFLAFPGRVNRENWVTQAKTLTKGGTTDFADRVDKGQVDY